MAFWAVIIVVSPLYRLAHQGDEGGFLYAYFAYFACFDGIAIGCCTAVVARRIPMRGFLATILQALTLGAMAFLYFYLPIGQTNVLGVTAMALGTAVLLLGAHYHPSTTALEHSHVLACLGWFERLSYELYLFHLIVPGAMRTVFPRVAVGDEKLLLMAAFLVLSDALSAAIARLYAKPLDRSIRRFLAPPGVNLRT